MQIRGRWEFIGPKKGEERLWGAPPRYRDDVWYAKLMAGNHTKTLRFRLIPKFKLIVIDDCSIQGWLMGSGVLPLRRATGSLYGVIKSFCSRVFTETATTIIRNVEAARNLTKGITSKSRSNIESQANRAAHLEVKAFFRCFVDFLDKKYIQNTNKFIDSSAKRNCRGYSVTILRMIENKINADRYKHLNEKDFRFRIFRELLIDGQDQYLNHKDGWRNAIAGGKATKATNAIIDGNRIGYGALEVLVNNKADIQDLSLWNMQKINYLFIDGWNTPAGVAVAEFTKFFMNFVRADAKTIREAHKVYDEVMPLMRGSKRTFMAKLRAIYTYIKDGCGLESQMNDGRVERMRLSRTLPVLIRESYRIHNQWNEFEAERRRADQENRAAIPGLPDETEVKLPDEKLIEKIEEKGAKVLKTVGEIRTRGAEQSHCLGSINYINEAIKGESVFVAYDDEEDGAATAQVRMRSTGAAVSQCYGPYNQTNKACEKLERMIQECA